MEKSIQKKEKLMSITIQNDSLGKKLNTRRAELGLSVKKVAEDIGVSESTYRDWENGRKISGEPYERIAKALNMPILKLITDQDMRVTEIEEEIKKLIKSVNNIEQMIVPFV